jgi:hypothetical protein
VVGAIDGSLILGFRQSRLELKSTRRAGLHGHVYGHRAVVVDLDGVVDCRRWAYRQSAAQATLHVQPESLTLIPKCHIN